MGIVNVTPDSFSDGGRFLDTGRAVEHALHLLAEGADILDFGGESTRPGAEPVSAEEEIRRVIPVIRAIRAQTHALLSIDTMKASVARAALAAGADIINDVTGLGGDPGMIQLAAETTAGLVVMHMRGTPASMQQDPAYQDVVTEVRSYFERRLHVLTDAGIDPARIVFDPGFGFGKTLDHNLQLLRHLPDLRIANRPLLVGISRKSMLSLLSGLDTVADRHWPTVALTAWLREQGADIHRVHEVAPNTQSLRMIEAILASS
jgi:dihydropteroate synthase